MGLFDTIECDYPVPDPRHQDLEFQTKDLACLLGRHTITRDGRLIKHPRGGLLEKDVELPIHGDIFMYDVDPEAGYGLIEYMVRFTHGRVEWIRRRKGQDESREAEPGSAPAITDPADEPAPGVMGRRVTAEEFAAHAPEKLELVGGRIAGDRKLLLLLLTSLGLRRAAALVGYELWRKALPEEGLPGPERGQDAPSRSP